MKTDTSFTNCLSFEQLQAYSAHTTNKLEQEQLYLHTSSCELCANAVNGFSFLPFSFVDLADLHHKIDVKTKASHARPFTFTHVSIVIISIISILGFYKWVDIFSENKTKFALVENVQLFSPADPIMESMIPVVEIKTVVIEKTVRKIKSSNSNLHQNVLIPIKEIESIPVDINESKYNNDNVVLKTNYNSDVIYIYDLKVADYNNLYFNHAPQAFNFKGYTPSFKENKGSLNNLIESEAVQSIAANRVLKSGLEYFSNRKYSKAIPAFQLLLENNPNDINALFYGALSLSQIGNYNSAINYLENVLKNSNNVFYQEAKWNLALLQLKTGEKQTAKQLLMEIESEKGFYSKKAEEKLKGL